MNWPAKRIWRWIVTSAALAALVGIGVWFVAPKPTDQVALPEVREAQLDTLAGTAVLFGHQSVGMNVLDGIAALYRDAGREPPAIIDVGADPDAVPATPAIEHAFVGVNGDPSSKFAAFRELVESAAGAGADVAFVKLCYLDVTAGTDTEAVFAEYHALMTELEAEHPDITFLYTTVPLTTDRSWRANLKALVGIDDQMGPADNRARERYNALVRAEYGGSRLFDVAAVQATLATAPEVRDQRGEKYHVMNAALSADAGHLNEAGGRIAAVELVRIIAGLDG
ncbi:SGNH/GDSL hydrolase family protein [Microbacterium sp. nov. GSS16]|uniref:SGNH/GDSL hydrolase family protein n=1 Tax=Microbacterium sp. nov. GSS16 TaxID=3019890 RepID=UPI0023050D89|nr:SGNH/GDSL hydrolase family protein [Microbacterium sp. nov. GSS16]WCD92924.1 SGNH/GDSL hydrolase family protein [Microbacterium sp. nov. GSS16]